MSTISQKAIADQQSNIESALNKAFTKIVQIADEHDGLLPSVLEPQTGQMFEEAPSPIPGQRQGDRARWGCNLMHDHPLLLTLLEFGQIHQRQDYIDTANAYLSRFTEHCMQTPSGLFPWGEHAYWRLDRDEVGNSNAEAGIDPTYPVIHDHLRAAPVWLWKKLDALNPACVQRYALGLDYHFKTDNPIEYSRHACLRASDPNLPAHKGYESSGRPRRLSGPDDGANDFPRHSGFYAMDIAFAWSQSGDAQLKTMLMRAADYWWNKQDNQGAFPLQSRGAQRPRLVSQTLSLAISLLKASEILQQGLHQDDALSQQFKQRAAHYIDLCYTEQCNEDWELLRNGGGNVWGGEYGHQKIIICRYPCLYLGLYRMTGQPRLLETAIMLATRIASTQLSVASDGYIPAMDTAMALTTYIDLYELTQDIKWLGHGKYLGQHILTVYFQQMLPVGASGISWYEAQLGTSYLLHAMARLSCLMTNTKVSRISPDYTNR